MGNYRCLQCDISDINIYRCYIIYIDILIEDIDIIIITKGYINDIR